MNYQNQGQPSGQQPGWFGHRPTPVSIRIVKFIVMRSGTYNPMYYRPYRTHYDSSVEEDLARRLYDNGPGQTTTALMAGIANRIIMPSAQHIGEIPIINGWQTPRGRFNLVLEITVSTGTIYYYHIQGYTSHYDTSYTGKPDPDMKFFVNSYVQLSRTQILGPNGVETRDLVTESAQVINGRLVANQLGSDIYGMRPNEIYSVLQGSQIASDVYAGEHQQMVRDTRHVFSHQSVPNSRSNNLPANILAKVVDSYQVGNGMLEYGQDRSGIYTRCKNYVYEGTLMENGFFRKLANISGVPDTTTFSMQELISIDPNVTHPSVSNFIVLDNRALSKLNHAGQSEYWHRPDDRNVWACSVLVNTVPTIMMEMMIMKIQFTANNHDHMGVNHVMITGAKDILSRDITMSLEAFKYRFVHEIMKDLTYGNTETYMLTMTIDLLGDTTIDIAYGSEPMTRYVTPSFCDSLITPVLTTNESILKDNVYDLTNVLQSVSQVHKPMVVNETI